MRVLCLGPHRLDVLGVRPSGRLHEVQRVVDAQVLELMFSKARVRPPPVCYDGSPRPHIDVVRWGAGWPSCDFRRVRQMIHRSRGPVGSIVPHER
ncbi:hypothetical protein M513_05156 [Trichuris suis]|uniref:Uncharacterized protein n=1 Tax=Trichuris suis TaxID=68888 RepID=A0A085M9J3_9BILA|nr:hypothetical protein M513_05156 [Trichuris suis]